MPWSAGRLTGSCSLTEITLCTTIKTWEKRQVSVENLTTGPTLVSKQAKNLTGIRRLLTQARAWISIFLTVTKIDLSLPVFLSFIFERETKYVALRQNSNRKCLTKIVWAVTSVVSCINVVKSSDIPMSVGDSPGSFAARKHCWLQTEWNHTEVS